MLDSIIKQKIKIKKMSDSKIIKMKTNTEYGFFDEFEFKTSSGEKLILSQLHSFKGNKAEKKNKLPNTIHLYFMKNMFNGNDIFLEKKEALLLGKKLIELGSGKT